VLPCIQKKIAKSQKIIINCLFLFRRKNNTTQGKETIYNMNVFTSKVTFEGTERIQRAEVFVSTITRLLNCKI